MYGSLISMREDQVTERDRETFLAALQQMSDGAITAGEATRALDDLIGPRSRVFCERWAKGVNGTRVPMRENAITEDDEDLLTEFFSEHRLDCARIEETLGTILGVS